MIKNTLVRAVCVLVALTAIAALVPLVGGAGLVARGELGSKTAPREIHVTVKDMTFYVDGQSDANPTLYAQSGEHIRLVLHNTDSGMSHDFTIDAWKVRTRVLKGKGQDVVEFTVPESRGSHAYRCTPHSEMMSGTIVVR